MSIKATLNGVTLENVTQLPILNKNNDTIATVLLEEIASGSSGGVVSGTFTPTELYNVVIPVSRKMNNIIFIKKTTDMGDRRFLGFGSFFNNNVMCVNTNVAGNAYTALLYKPVTGDIINDNVVFTFNNDNIVINVNQNTGGFLNDAEYSYYAW